MLIIDFMVIKKKGNQGHIIFIFSSSLPAFISKLSSVSKSNHHHHHRSTSPPSTAPPFFFLISSCFCTISSPCPLFRSPALYSSSASPLLLVFSPLPLLDRLYHRQQHHQLLFSTLSLHRWLVVTVVIAICTTGLHPTAPWSYCRLPGSWTSSFRHWSSPPLLCLPLCRELPSFIPSVPSELRSSGGCLWAANHLNDPLSFTNSEGKFIQEKYKKKKILSPLLEAFFFPNCSLLLSSFFWYATITIFLLLITFTVTIFSINWSLSLWSVCSGCGVVGPVQSRWSCILFFSQHWFR